MRIKPIVHLAEYLGVRLSLCLLQALPLDACRWWARRIAWLMWRVLRVRKDVIEANLLVAFPDSTPAQRETIARGMWEHLLLMVAEIAHAPRKVHRTNWRQHSRIPQLEAMVRRLLDRRPMVLISGHLGNFEVGGYMLGLHGFPTHTIARRLDNPLLDRWINSFRSRTGQYILAKHGCSAEIEKLLRDGGTLALLGDQHAGDNGCWIDFFGKPASTHKAVALFTLSSDAPTATVAMIRAGKPLCFEMHVADLIDPRERREDLGTVRQLTEWFTTRLEDAIRTAPDQYWWLHQRWRSRPARLRRGRRDDLPAAA